TLPRDFSASATEVSSAEPCDPPSRRCCPRVSLDLPFLFPTGPICSAFFTALFEPAFLMYFRSLSHVHAPYENQTPKARFKQAYNFFYRSKQQKNSLTDHFIVIFSACQTLGLYPIQLKCNPL